MKKEEILARCKNQGLDEMEQNIFLSSFGFGNIITAILCFILIAINGFRGQGYYGFITIVFATISSSAFYQYKRLKHIKVFLLSAIAASITGIISFIMFVVKG